MSDVNTRCGRRRGGHRHADAEMAAEAGARCEPGRPADRLGLGAEERRFGSRAQVNMVKDAPNVAGRPRSGARRNGVRHPSRTCGESSIPSLSNDSADLHFACRAQVARSSSTRSRSTPTPTHTQSPFTSSRRRRRTPSARTVGVGVGRGYGRAGGREGTRMRRAVAGRAREDTPHRRILYHRILCLCILHPVS